MDLATVCGRYFHKTGKLENLVVSDEINACTIQIEVEYDGKKEPWYLLFKNETHNHPTEIEPFGGASTCLGGAIRDPLSGDEIEWSIRCFRTDRKYIEGKTTSKNHYKTGG